MKHIWKSEGKLKYCKECWYSINPPEKPKQRTPVKKVSDKRKKDMSVYDKRRLAFLSLHKFCQANLPQCTKLATEVHHKRGRVGDDYLNISTWLAACNSCHHWITEHSKEAIEMGLSMSRLKKDLEN